MEKKLMGKRQKNEVPTGKHINKAGDVVRNKGGKSGPGDAPWGFNLDKYLKDTGATVSSSLNDRDLVGSHNLIYNSDGSVDSSSGGGGTGSPFAGMVDLNVPKDLTGLSIDDVVQGARKTKKTGQKKTL